MNRIVERLRGEHGQALPLALAMMAIVALLTAALTLNGATNQRNSLTSSDAKAAFSLASTTLAYAQGQVLAGDIASQTANGSVDAPGGLTGTWTAVEINDGCNCTWQLTAVGTVNGVTRSVSEIATDQSTKSTINTNVWNYLYADGTGSCTTVNGNVTISVPLLVRGSLCLSGSQLFTGSQLKVGGSLSLSGSAHIGTSGTKISYLQVAGSCDGVTAGTGICNGSNSPIYASSVSPSLDVTPQMPCIGQPSAYDPQCTGANDGTWTTLKSEYTAQAALAKTGCLTNMFDNDATLNNSDTSISSVMLGNTDYDCKVGSNEIKWNHATKTLYANGTFYFDGSLTLSGTIVYSGLATLYFTGGVSGGNNSSFCGISGCTKSWDTTTNAIVFVAGCWSNSTGTALITSACVSLSGGATAQFGAYCTTEYYVSGNSSNMGPVLANTLNLAGGISSLIPFKYMPPGTPLNYDIQHVPATVKSWSG